jgi:hydroxypyruvate isomerase
MLRFALNISITMPTIPLLDRFDAAARLGFDTVEFWWPSDADLRAVARRIRDAGLKVALVNFDAGALAQGERGMLNHPTRQAEFRANVPRALDFAQQIGCPRMNALAGKWLPDEPREAQLERVHINLHWACTQAAAANVAVVVEAVNAWENPGYLFTDTPTTLAFLQRVAAPNLAYQYDCYHMQLMEGNLTRTIRTHAAQIGHIQIADVPDRHQPGTGELHYPFIFAAIAASGYTGYVGLEYVPQGDLAASLAWLPLAQRGDGATR